MVNCINKNILYVFGDFKIRLVEVLLNTINYIIISRHDASHNELSFLVVCCSFAQFLLVWKIHGTPKLPFPTPLFEATVRSSSNCNFRDAPNSPLVGLFHGIYFSYSTNHGSLAAFRLSGGPILWEFNWYV